MRLGLKLPLLCACALLVASCAGAIGVIQLNRANAGYQRLVEVDVEQARLVTAALLHFKTQVQEWKNTLLRGADSARRTRYWDAFAAEESQVVATAGRLQATLGSSQAGVLVAQFSQAHARMGSRYRAGFEAFAASGYDPQAGDRAVAGIDREPAELLAQAEQLISAGTAVAVAQARQASRRATVVSLLLLATVSVVGTLLAVWIARGVVESIDRVRAIARRVADGDLTVHGEISGRDEVALLMASLMSMADRLRALVNTVRGASDSIAAGSGQIAAGNLDLSRRTEDQASALQQTSSSLVQLNTTVKQNADNALQANQLAQGASTVAVRGGEVVGQVVQTMKDINDSSRRIEDIIGVIDGIAFQTNILALNAAVEAARAGEEGRGFAVVAGEVRTLAQRSAEAAKEIRSLIAASVSRVEHGSQLVDQAGATMNEIVEAISRVTMIMGEITAASSEQSAGVSQVGEAVAQMDRSTQQNAALVEQSAAAAESLREQARGLVESVAGFRTAQTSVGAHA